MAEVMQRFEIEVVDGSKVSRVLLDNDPYATLARNDWDAAVWPGSWVWLSAAADPPAVLATRCRFECAQRETFRLHVSADERYELWLDGVCIGRGAERGDPSAWFFDSYELELSAGTHVLAARVWAWGWKDFVSPSAQMSIRPGWLVSAEGKWSGLLSTGRGAWEAKRLAGIEPIAPQRVESGQFAGGFERIDGRAFDWGFEHGKGDGWQPMQIVETAQADAFHYGEFTRRHPLRPAGLPPRVIERKRFVEVRHAQHLTPEQANDPLCLRVEQCNNDEAIVQKWQTMIAGGSAVEVPANTCLRLIIDAKDYFTAYPELIVSGGRDAAVRWHWAEALFSSPEIGTSGDAGDAVSKGHRDGIDKRFFRGKGDIFIADGGEHRRFSTLWWRAGRYIELVVRTESQPLLVDSLSVLNTHYTLVDDWSWQSSEPRIDAMLPILRAGLQACMHEHYTDCPYYEQLMYTGDTRLEILTTYLLTRDARLANRSIELYDASRVANGLTQARYPSYDMSLIPPFSLWWVAMVDDAACWRGDRELVQRMMPGVRAVLERWRAMRNRDGLVERPNGWNFVDWVPGWKFGCPPGAINGVNTTINWHLAWTLRMKAGMERWLGEELLAQRDEQAARELADALHAASWDASRGLFREAPHSGVYSEHAQCLAILSGLLDDEYKQRCLDGLVNASDLARTTIYFSFYLLETLGLNGLHGPFFERLSQWHGLPGLGFVCPPESPEPSRSDCHAWGSHPLFHLFANVVGIRPRPRPRNDGVDQLTLRPMLGPLTHAKGSCAHVRGTIDFDLQKRGDRVMGRVALPQGVSMELLTADAIAIITKKPTA